MLGTRLPTVSNRSDSAHTLALYNMYLYTMLKIVNGFQQVSGYTMLHVSDIKNL
jgi:hypothetical protein